MNIFDISEIFTNIFEYVLGTKFDICATLANRIDLHEKATKLYEIERNSKKNSQKGPTGQITRITLDPLHHIKVPASSQYTVLVMFLFSLTLKLINDITY